MGSNGKNLTSLNGDGLDRGGKWEIRAFMMLSILVLCGKLADNCNQKRALLKLTDHQLAAPPNTRNENIKAIDFCNAADRKSKAWIFASMYLTVQQL